MSGLLLAQAWLLGLGLWAHRMRPGYRPGAWLVLIGAGLMPTLAALVLLLRPEAGHTVAYTLGKSAASTPAPRVAEGGSLPSLTMLLGIYTAVALFLVGRMLLRLARLHRVARRSPGRSGIRLADTALPPFALGWPTRGVVVGRETWDALTVLERAMLLAHERTHLAHRDPEATAGLLLLSHLLWLNPGLRLLVERWRAAIEVRADRAALSATDNPKLYPRLLLRLSRAHGLPSPTATHGDLHMRIKTLLSASPQTRLPRPMLGLAALACAGTLAVAANAADAPQPIKRVPPVMPDTCPDWFDTPGFELEIMTDRALTRDDTVMMFGSPTAKVGEVILRFDVGADGVPKNIAVTKTNADCFRQPAIDAVSKWRYETGKPARGASNMMRFMLTFEEGADVKSELEAFTGG